MGESERPQLGRRPKELGRERGGGEQVEVSSRVLS